MKYREMYNRENPGNVPQDWPPKAPAEKVPEEVKQKQRELMKAKEEAEAKKAAENEAKDHPDVDIGPSFDAPPEEAPVATPVATPSEAPKVVSQVQDLEEVKQPTFDAPKSKTHDEVAISTENGGVTETHKWHQEVYDVTV